MDLRIRTKADLGSWRALGRRFIFCLFSSVILLFFWNLVIAYVITIALRPIEPYAQWDPVTFMEWKVPYEMAVLIVVLLPSIAFLIARIFFDISSIPLQNQQDQLAETDRVEETTATSNRSTPELASSDFERRAPRHPVQAAVTKNSPQSSHKNPIQAAETKNSPQSPLNNPMQAAETKNSPQSSHKNPIQAAETRHSPQSPHDIGSNGLSFLNEVLNRLNTSSSLEQTPSAAGTSSEPLQGRSHTSSTCSNASTEKYPGVPQCDQGSFPEIHRTSEPSEPLQGISQNSPPSSIASTEQRNQGSVSEARTAPESITPSGEDARERLFQEVLSWPYVPNEHLLREFLHFDSDDPERPFRMPPSAQLDRERRMLERRSARGKVTDTEEFRVYGIPELWEHDRLKCWVYLNQFCHGQRWPEGYTPLCTGEELNSHVEYDDVDDMTSIWSGVGSNGSQI